MVHRVLGSRSIIRVIDSVRNPAFSMGAGASVAMRDSSAIAFG
jgi:hypothetical protein